LNQFASILPYFYSESKAILQKEKDDFSQI